MELVGKRFGFLGDLDEFLGLGGYEFLVEGFVGSFEESGGFDESFGV